MLFKTSPSSPSASSLGAAQSCQHSKLICISLGAAQSYQHSKLIQNRSETSVAVRSSCWACAPRPACGSTVAPPWLLRQSIAALTAGRPRQMLQQSFRSSTTVQGREDRRLGRAREQDGSERCKTNEIWAASTSCSVELRLVLQEAARPQAPDRDRVPTGCR